MTKKFGAAKVATECGPVWCHYSEQGDTLKLRRFESGAILDFDMDGQEIEDRLPLSDCRKIAPGEASYSIEKNPSVWIRILNALQTGSMRKAVGGTSPQPLIVPVTRLRRYYSSMKVFEIALLHNIAEFYLKKPDALESLWNDSRRQFTTYRNHEGWGEGKRKDLPRSPQRLDDVSNTYEFTSFVMQHGLADSGLEVIHYEINPWRTRGARLSKNKASNRNKTGTGGIDLLMRSTEGNPVVGEVKVKNDKNAFFGLLQAMTYAVELSTPNQLERLRTHLSRFNDLVVEKAAVEISVIKVNPVFDPTLESVLRLITLINNRANCGGLARIRLFQNDGNNWVSYQ